MAMIWAEAPGGFGELYEVSNQGQIRNKWTGRILKLYVQDDAGKQRVIVSLSNRKRGGRQTVHVARLVIETFEERELAPNEIVGYRDGNFKNVSFANLYVTTREVYEDLDMDHLANQALARAQQGWTLEQAAKEIGVSDFGLQRLLGVVFWNRVRKAAGQKPEKPVWATIHKGTGDISVGADQALARPSRRARTARSEKNSKKTRQTSGSARNRSARRPETD